MPQTPAIGSMRLFDKVVPDLAAGSYRVTSSLDIAEGNNALAAPAAQRAHIRITAPRFSLASSDVAEAFPPPGAKGAFDQRLPHLVMGRRTLPWERRIAATASPGRHPWLALMLVQDGEGAVATGPLRSLLPQGAITALEALEPIDGNPAVSVLQMRDAATLRALLPTRDEAALLAHVRQVNLSDTAMARGDDDGWFAVVAANRLPLAPAGDVQYTACLVSLEGRDDLWAPGMTQAPPLVLLHAWPFTTAAQGGTFEALAEELDVAPFGGAAGDGGIMDTLGRVAVVQTDHAGNTADAFYRGPLLGLTEAPPPPAADDLSLSAAHELGRLLGIADGRLLRDLVEWHRKAEAEIRAGLELDQLQLPASLATLPAGQLTIARMQQEVSLSLDTSHLKVASIGRLTLLEIEP